MSNKRHYLQMPMRDRKPWRISHVVRKMRANAQRCDRALHTERLPLGVIRDIETSARAARRAADRLERILATDGKG